MPQPAPERSPGPTSTTTAEDSLSSSNPVGTGSSIRPRRAFGTLMAAQLILYLGVGCVVPALPLYASAIGLSSSLSGVVIAAPAGAMLVVARAAGGWADLARKPAMLWGMLVIAVADAATAFSTGAAGLIVARLALGVGRGASEAGERGMLADLANRVPGLRGRALAVQQAVAALGLAVGAPLGGLAVEHFGIRAAFLCVTAAAVAALAVYSRLPETVVLPEEERTSGQSLSPGENNAKKQQQSDDSSEQRELWRDLLKKDAWRALCFAEAGARVTYAAKISVVPVLAAGVFDGSPTAAGLVLSVAAASGLVGAPLGGAAADFFGPRKVALVAGVLSGLGLVAVPWALSDRSCFVAAIALWSAAVSAQGPALTALAQLRAPPGREAASLALTRFAGDAAFLVTPVLLGAVADTTASIMPGLDCALAGVAILTGALTLLTFSTGPASSSSSSLNDRRQ